LRARNDAGGGLGRHLPCSSDKVFEFAEHCVADFICGRAVEREFQNAVAPFPAQSFASNDSCGRPSVVHRVDLRIIPFRDGVALEFTVAVSKTVFGSKRTGQNLEIADLR